MMHEFIVGFLLGGCIGHTGYRAWFEKDLALGIVAVVLIVVWVLT